MSENGYLNTRESILELADLKTGETVVNTVGAWKGKKIRIQELTAYGRLRAFAVKHDEGDPSHAEALICVYGIINNEGDYIFTEADIADIKKKNFLAIRQLAEDITRLSNITMGTGKKRKKKPMKD